MPSAPYAALRVARNGGVPATGAITCAFGDEIQLSADPSGTPGVTAYRWEIYEYPEGFTVPASWTEDPTTHVYYSLAASPPAFTLPTESAYLWGKFLLRLTINNGDPGESGLDPAQFVDESTAFEIPSRSGVPDVAYLEGAQFDSRRRWVGAFKEFLRHLDNVIFGTLETKVATHTSSGAGYETIASLTYTVAEGTYVDVVLSATGSIDGGEYAHYEKVARFTRPTGGTAEEDWNVDIYGSPKEKDLVWDVQIVLSVNDVQIQTKANSDNPDWRITRAVTVQTLP